jgi:hypothetical protein
MRITRDILLNQAKENATKLVARYRYLVCIYLTGSLLRDDPFIGGVTDIDLVCVHGHPVSRKREVIRLSPEISLDLAHYDQEEFEPARKLRMAPWMGGDMETVPLVLYDGLRWYDYTRAAATAQFWRADNIAARARGLLSPARKTWNELTDEAIPQGLKRVTAFLDAIQGLSNALVCLSSTPLPIRRLMLELPEKAAQVDMPEFYGELIQLFTSEAVTDQNLETWLTSYGAMFDELKEAKEPPTSLQPFRRAYYEKAIRAVYPSHPAAAIWILLRSWTQAAAHLAKSGQGYKDWQSFCKQLELDTARLPARLEVLDHLLDTVEEAVDRLQA